MEQTKLDSKIDLDLLMAHMGGFGRYQMQQFALLLLPVIAAGMHMISMVTVAPEPPHRCFIPGVDDVQQSSAVDADVWNSTDLLQYIPMKKERFDSCLMFSPSGNGTVKCDKWVYDTTYYKSSKVMQFDLVCDRRWIRSVLQSLYMTGVLLGAIFLGSAADRFGRKAILVISSFLQFIFAFSIAFTFDIYSWAILNIFYGMFASSGALLTSFVLVMELVSTSKRTACGMIFEAFFAIGVMLTAFWGFLVPDNWQILQSIFACHSLLLFGHFWFVDESIRWLWSQGHREKALKIAEKAYRLNGRTLNFDVLSSDGPVANGQAADLDSQKPNTLTCDSQPISNGVNSQPTSNGVEKEWPKSFASQDHEKAGQEEKLGFIDLFRTTNLRNRMLNTCYNWFANSLVYYGLSLNTGQLPIGNPYLNLFLVGLVEMPAYVMVALLMDRLGRRSMLSSLMVMGGALCITSAYIPLDISFGREGVVIAVLFGKLMIAGSFAIIYNYTAELFPTPLRNTAIGTGCMNARLSGALTPFISLLDKLDPSLPMVIFGTVSITAGLLALILPETLNKELPQTLYEGENFGIGDNCFSVLTRRGKNGSQLALKHRDRSQSHLEYNT